MRNLLKIYVYILEGYSEKTFFVILSILVSPDSELPTFPYTILSQKHFASFNKVFNLKLEIENFILQYLFW